MPGRLIMDQQGAPCLDDPKKDHSQAPQIGNDSSVSAGDDSGVLPVAAVNGFANHGQNGGTSNGVDLDHASTGSRPDDVHQLHRVLGVPPPSLDQSWRTSDANKPLGKLIARLAQQCYADLHQVLDEMSNIGPGNPATQRPIITNSQPNPQDQSEASVARKQKLLDFASEQRDRFIKTLILADWGRDEEDIAKLIDLKVWLDKHRMAHGHAAQDIGQIKIDAIPTKTPNPNIDHALELLSTGKASWIPDMSYLPVKKLSAKQLLKTLRSMNVTLATRLNLHDELPPHMQHFSVADGRATFTVPGEFEVDLAVADEDPSSPFFFIDIRFLFSPSTNDLRDQLRGPVEIQINSVLAKKGLKSCYDLLHNFVLTAKIRTVHEQAERLRSGKWHGCMHVEARRRIVIVQYWAGKSGPKSWLEFGIASGVVPGKRYRTPPTPCISVKWIRAGVEVSTEDIGFDWVQLDVEKCLLAVIAEHTSHILQTIESRLLTFAPKVSSLKTYPEDSKDLVEYSSLELSLPGLRAPLNLRVQSITGQYSIRPPSPQALNTERYMNDNTAIDAAALIAALSCATLRTQFDILAVPLDWLPVREISFKDQALSALLKIDVRKHRVVRCPGKWSPDWILLVTFGLHGIAWWIVNVEENSTRPHNGQAISVIKTHLQLPTTDAFGKTLPLSRTSLLCIEKLAAEYISNTVFAQSLVEKRIPHMIERPVLTAHSPRNHSSVLFAAPNIFVRFSSVMRDEHKTAWKPWASDVMRVKYQGTEQKDSTIMDLAVTRFDLRLSILPGKMKHLQRHLIRSLLKEITTQLQKVEALDSCITCLVQAGFVCTTLSLTKLAFRYSSSPPLSAEVWFKTERSAVLKLEPRDSNPHLRIRLMLEKALNDKSEQAFGTFTNLLTVTLPLLQTVDKLIACYTMESTLVVHVRSCTWYTLKYKSPLENCVFSIRARASVQQGRRVIRWHIQGPQPLSSNTPVSEELTKAIKEIWQRTDDHCLGCGTSIIADALGIGPVLESLDAVLRRFPLVAQGATMKRISTPSAKDMKQEPDFITID
nr:mediator of rna polymerase ii transcription subunit 14 [Quercus suber]